MSRKTVLFTRKLRQQTTRNVSALLPNADVRGTGMYLERVPTANRKAPHGPRGVGQVCSRVMGADKKARLSALAK